MWKYLGTASGFGDWGQEPPQLEIHLIDVGKADAILIKSQGQAALLDAGQAVSAGEVIDYLYRHDVERLDYLIMSHPDRDHIGGMPQILQELPVAELMQPPLSPALQPESQEFSDLLAGLEELSVPQTQWWMGESIYLGGPSALLRNMTVPTTPLWYCGSPMAILPRCSAEIWNMRQSRG